MPNQSAPIGVFDSGLGGLTVLQSLVRRLPGEDFIYLGDTARTPYGSKGAETIRRYSRECASFLLKKGVKALVVACNTSTATALDDLEKFVPCPVIGTVSPAVARALALSEAGRIGVIGTEATVASGVYERALKNGNSSLTVVSAPCPLFVPLVEQGMFDGDIVERVVQLHIASLRAAEVDSLVLGCTHYPLLRDSIASYMGERCKLVACSDAVADATAEMLTEQRLGRDSSGSGQVRYFVTDAVPRFSRLAKILMDQDGVSAEKVSLD